MENEKKNNNKTILIIVLSIIIFCLLAFIIYDKVLSNKKDDKEDNNTPDVTVKTEEIAIDSKEVTDAMNAYESIYLLDKNLYSKDVYKVTDITNYELVGTALKNYDGDQIAYCISESSQLKDAVPMKVLNDSLNKYVQKTIDINTVKSLDKDASYPLAEYEVRNIGLIVDGDGVKLIGPCGAEWGAEDYVNKKVVKAEKAGDLIYVYEKQAFGRYDLNSGDTPLVNYYKDYEKTTLIEKGLDSIMFTDGNGNPGPNSTPNWDLYNTYKYTFKVIDEKYYFQSIELVK